MARVRVVLNSAGLTEVLTSSTVEALMQSVGEEVAAAAEQAYPTPRSGGPVDVKVYRYTASGGNLKGRRAAVVLVAKHPASVGYEARYGVLRRAAASTGLEVR